MNDEKYDLGKLSKGLAKMTANWDKEFSSPHYGTVSLSDVDRTCLSWWFPKLVEAELPVPITRFIAFGTTKEVQATVVDGEHSELLCGIAGVLESLVDASGIGYPYFLRTGHFSGKHQWEKCCFVDRDSRLIDNIRNLANFEALAGVSCANPSSVWVVREMLPTKPIITCTNYGNFPVAREIRVFVDGPDIAYLVPYWPEGAIEEGVPAESNWRGRMADLMLFSDDDLNKVLELASKAGAAVGGRWSVDILDTERGWFITDMAVAEMSYGYDHQKYLKGTESIIQPNQ